MESVTVYGLYACLISVLGVVHRWGERSEFASIPFPTVTYEFDNSYLA